MRKKIKNKIVCDCLALIFSDFNNRLNLLTKAIIQYTSYYDVFNLAKCWKVQWASPRGQWQILRWIFTQATIVGEFKKYFFFVKYGRNHTVY